MYKKHKVGEDFDPHAIEEICYEGDHIDRVETEIKVVFPEYFHKYLHTESGNSPDNPAIKKLAEKFGSQLKERKTNVDPKVKIVLLFQEAYESFLKDRPKYTEILNAEALQEYESNPTTFKNIVLKNKCPVIHSTLHNKAAKELDKFRNAFNVAEAIDLLSVVQNIVSFADQYKNSNSGPPLYSGIPSFDEMSFAELQNEEYTVFGVIGGGIRSTFLHKLHPDLFPSRSREAIWALWYLTSKKVLGCHEDSEFLMIDQEKSITQQNYFYPYDLFGHYAYVILNLIAKEAEKYSVSINKDLRFTVLDSFLSFVAQCNQREIDLLKQKVDEDGNGY